MEFEGNFEMLNFEDFGEFGQFVEFVEEVGFRGFGGVEEVLVGRIGPVGKIEKVEVRKVVGGLVGSGFGFGELLGWVGWLELLKELLLRGSLGSQELFVVLEH